ncbi:MAG: ribose-5-phosphate isomerase RpiA [Planctomycetota bacterium]
MESGVENAKRAVGRAAAADVPDGSRIGLGTGSTVEHLLIGLSERVREGLKVLGVSTSETTENRARELGIETSTLDRIDRLDLAIDGADEIDPRGAMIKGGGAAMTREKIVARAAAEFWVIADQKKLVDHLGQTHPLPIEVLPFGWRQTLAGLADLGLRPDLRLDDHGNPVRTDQENLVLDAALDADLTNTLESLRTLDRQILAIAGVVESGLFLDFRGRVYTAGHDGDVDRRNLAG